MMKKKAAATNAMRDISLALLVLVIRAKLGTLLTELAQLGHAKNAMMPTAWSAALLALVNVKSAKGTELC